MTVHLARMSSPKYALRASFKVSFVTVDSFARCWCPAITLLASWRESLHIALDKMVEWTKIRGWAYEIDLAEVMCWFIWTMLGGGGGVSVRTGGWGKVIQEIGDNTGTGAEASAGYERCECVLWFRVGSAMSSMQIIAFSIASSFCKILCCIWSTDASWLSVFSCADCSSRTYCFTPCTSMYASSNDFSLDIQDQDITYMYLQNSHSDKGGWMMWWTAVTKGVIAVYDGWYKGRKQDCMESWALLTRLSLAQSTQTLSQGDCCVADDWSLGVHFELEWEAVRFW